MTLVERGRALPYHEAVVTRVASPDFIGRTGELGAITEAIARGAAGDTVVVLVGGDAGIGKSRLVAEAAAAARAQGALVLEGGCVSLGNGEGLPFAPIVEALRRLPAMIAEGGAGPITALDELRSTETGDIGRLMPELGTASTSDTGLYDRPDWVQARIFEGVLALLRAMGERIPVLLIVEDLHWSDGSTRDLLSFLARNVRAERLAIVGTYRTDDLHRRHPLRPWLAEMERLPRVIRVEVGRFGRSELARQIEAILGHRPPTALVDAITARADGNPFFVEELLASGVEDGAKRIPATLRDVLLTRVTALSDDAQRVLGIAAVAGRTAEPALLAAVAALPEAVLEDPLREAVGAQILTTQAAPRGDAYRFRHALLAEAVYDDLLPSERRRLHAAYASVGRCACGRSTHGYRRGRRCTHGCERRARLPRRMPSARQRAPSSTRSSCGTLCVRTIDPRISTRPASTSRPRSPGWSAARPIVQSTSPKPPSSGSIATANPSGGWPQTSGSLVRRGSPVR